MANREIYPTSISPLQGDVSAPPGGRLVTVTGIQGTPVSATVPSDQNFLVFDGGTSEWIPAAGTGTALTVNGAPTSDDFDVYVNAGPLVKVNGV